HADEGIEVYSSRNLKTWKYEGIALHKSNTTQTRWFWAPEVYHLGDKYYMYYSANERLYVATADSPLGPYRQQGGQMMQDVIGDMFSIDSHIFFDDDGSAWMFCVLIDDGLCIWQVQLDKDFVTPIPSTLKKCISVSADWENIWPRVNEGPNVVKHNGKYYLTYSANSYESQDYGVGYATADSLTGEWKKYAGNPILHRYKELVGVGHHTMFRNKRGKLRIAFHAHQSVERIHPRTMYIGTMEFTPQGVMQMTDKGFIRPKSNRPDIVQ
ncbi:MAG: glycoside hydrolase family 43 protein, partial [Alistipes sp.]|nr:glycoside hydrolase family 43 protein [Alistipes sp.]